MAGRRILCLDGLGCGLHEQVDQLRCHVDTLGLVQVSDEGLMRLCGDALCLPPTDPPTLRHFRHDSRAAITCWIGECGGGAVGAVTGQVSRGHHKSDFAAGDVAA